MGGQEDRPTGSIRIGDKIVVEVGGTEVTVVVRSLQARGQPQSLIGSLGFSAAKDDDGPPLADEGQETLPGVEE